MPSSVCWLSTDVVATIRSGSCCDCPAKVRGNDSDVSTVFGSNTRVGHALGVGTTGAGIAAGGTGEPLTARQITSSACPVAASMLSVAPRLLAMIPFMTRPLRKIATGREAGCPSLPVLFGIAVVEARWDCRANAGKPGRGACPSATGYPAYAPSHVRPRNGVRIDGTSRFCDQPLTRSLRGSFRKGGRTMFLGTRRRLVKSAFAVSAAWASLAVPNARAAVVGPWWGQLPWQTATPPAPGVGAPPPVAATPPEQPNAPPGDSNPEVPTPPGTPPATEVPPSPPFTPPPDSPESPPGNPPPVDEPPTEVPPGGGNPPPTTESPEPATALLALVGVGAVAIRRRKK